MVHVFIIFFLVQQNPILSLLEWESLLGETKAVNFYQLHIIMLLGMSNFAEILVLAQYQGIGL
jgi:hypothetical protein